MVTVFNSADHAFTRAETSVSAAALISVFKIFNVLKVLVESDNVKTKQPVWTSKSLHLVSTVLTASLLH